MEDGERKSEVHRCLPWYALHCRIEIKLCFRFCDFLHQPAISANAFCVVTDSHFQKACPVRST